jgi:hypothetical protein
MGLYLLLRSSFSGFLGQHRLDARHVLADSVHAGGVLKLAGGLTEAQVERFLLEGRSRSSRSWSGVFVFSSCAFMRFSFSQSPDGPFAEGSPKTWRINDKPPNPSHPGAVDAVV